jgi:hypothetical protein
MAHLLKSWHAENDSAMTHSALKVAKKWALQQPFGSIIMPHRYSVVFKSLAEALPAFKKRYSINVPLVMHLGKHEEGSVCVDDVIFPYIDMCLIT